MSGKTFTFRVGSIVLGRTTPLPALDGYDVGGNHVTVGLNRIVSCSVS